MHLRPGLSALAAVAFTLGVLPAVALGLTLEPADPVAEHVAHDARLADIEVAGPTTLDEPVEEAGDGAVQYEIQEGDSLATIAALHGLDDVDDWRLLFDANPDIEHPDLIEPGMVIRIPEPGEQLEPRALPAPVVQAARGGRVAGGDVWAALARCESGGRNIVSSNGLYYGYFQFLVSTWHSVGGTGVPTDHSYGEQLHRAQILQARAGWRQWPACARALGLR
jgi:hypothetical protein